jgi:cobalamin biosynthesis protein CobT
VFEFSEESEAPTSSVMLLVDSSGSMGWTDMKEANTTALAFAKAFQRMSVDVEVNYYCDHYNGSEIYQAKAFGKKLDEPRFGVSYGGGTPTHDAVFCGLSRLINAPSTNKIMFVITDGQPNEVALLYHAEKLAVQAGIKVIPIGLGQEHVRGFTQSVYAKDAEAVNAALKQAIKNKLF